jgi:arsenical pump membrane protein
VIAVVIAALALLGVIVRPFKTNEAWWAAGGAVALVLVRALSPQQAGAALARGIDVYLFLVGMMALAEFARVEGVFDWIATHAVRAARGSRGRLLILVYAAGILTTAFLSNDATIVVLTPAVITAIARTDARPEPYVVACALVANTASLTLPIANPANLLFFAGGMPRLATWFGSFALASLAALVLTYAALVFVFRRALRPTLASGDGVAAPPRILARVVLVFVAVTLVITASRAGALGAVTFALGVVATVLAATARRDAPLAIARGVAWPIVVLTAGLFVIVEALDASGAAALPRALFTWAAHAPAPLANVIVGVTTALASNVVNNLPVAMDLGRYAAGAHPSAALTSAALVGVNVGPNLTTNGSLATLLWLAILRRSDVPMTPWRFAAIGCAATPLALIAASLAAR